MNDAKGLLWLRQAMGKPHQVEVRPKRANGWVCLELHRNDCKPSPMVRMELEDARALLRRLQSACDSAHHWAREVHRQGKVDAELNAMLDRLGANL